MSVLVLVMADGRADYLERSMASLGEMLVGVDRAARLIHDDSGDRAHGRWLRRTWPDWSVVSTGARSGFAGAIRSAWRLIGREYGDVTHVFHAEQDFTYRHRIDVPAMCALLDRHPHLAQVALMRQPWNETERAAGSVWSTRPAGSWTQREDERCEWVEHRHWWTTNPCVYRRSLLSVGWPEGAESEGRFGLRLFADGTPEVDGPDVRSAFWGRVDDDPWVTHVGYERVGVGY